MFKLLASDGVSDVSDFVCRPGLCCYVSVLWKEYSVQDRFKTLQGVFVILGPGWNAVMSGRMWQCGHWFGCGLVDVKRRDIIAVKGRETSIRKEHIA